MTITLPTDYTFTADAAVTTDAGDGFVESISADMTAITAVIPPGSTGAATLTGLSASFLPGVPLTLPTVDEVAAVGTPIGGDSPAAAPDITTPALDATTTFFDAGGFTGADISGDGGVGAQYYKFTVTEAGSYSFSTSWPGAADVDAVVCFDPACSDGAFVGASADNPEEGSATLDPGTYYYVAVLFAGTPPPFVRLDLTHEAPPAP